MVLPSPSHIWEGGPVWQTALMEVYPPSHYTSVPAFGRAGSNQGQAASKARASVQAARSLSDGPHWISDEGEGEAWWYRFSDAHKAVPDTLAS